MKLCEFCARRIITLFERDVLGRGIQTAEDQERYRDWIRSPEGIAEGTPIARRCHQIHHASDAARQRRAAEKRRRRAAKRRRDGR